MGKDRLVTLPILMVVAGLIHIHRLCDQNSDEQQTGNPPEWRQISVAAAIFFG